MRLEENVAVNSGGLWDNTRKEHRKSPTDSRNVWAPNLVFTNVGSIYETSSSCSTLRICALF